MTYKIELKTQLNPQKLVVPTKTSKGHLHEI